MNIIVLRNLKLIEGNDGEPLPSVSLIIKDDIIINIIEDKN
jgi:hypothetical protein